MNYRGHGYFVAVFTFASALFCNWAFDAHYGPGYYSSHRWTIGVALMLAAVPCWLVGRYLRRQTSRVFIDKATGREVVFDLSHHTFFFIPMVYWAVLLFFIGLGFFAFEMI